MPAAGRDLGIVIPCHNEAHAIAAVVLAAASLRPRMIVVVDDGSTDETARRAHEAGAKVLRSAARQGKGAALALGWQACRDAGTEWVLMLDGDGQHDPAEARALLAKAGPRTPLVIGDRLGRAGDMPLLRRWTNRVMNRCLAIVAGTPLRDSQSGFRLAHLPTLLALRLRSRHYEIESEMCSAFARAGLAIDFVPVTCRYAKERSKILPVQDTLRWMGWFLACCFRHGMTSFLGPSEQHPGAMLPPDTRMGQVRRPSQAPPFFGTPPATDGQHGVMP